MGPNRQLPPPADYADLEVVDESSSSPMTGVRIRKVLLALKRYWWIPLLTLLFGVAGGMGVLQVIPPTYVSRAQMWDAVKIQLPEGRMFTEDPQTFLGTQSELLKSPTIQELAMERLRLVGTNIPIPRGNDNLPIPVDVQMRQAVKSAVYILTATGPEPTYTRAYLDALIQAYLEYKANMRKTVTGGTLASITEQVQRSERDLREAQERLTDFQRTNNLVILQQESTAAGGYLAQLRTRLADLELEAQLLGTALGSNVTSTGDSTNALATEPLGGWFQANVTRGTGAGLASSVPPEVQVALRELGVLEAQRDRLSRYLRAKHPKMVKISSDMARVNGLLDIYRRQNQDQLGAALRAIALRIASVKASIGEWEAKVIEANSRIADAENLRNQVLRAQSNSDRLNMLVQTVGISRNIDQDSLAVLQPATTAERSLRPEISAVAGCGMAGLALGLGLVGLIAWRDDRFDSRADLSATVGGLIVGHLPEVALGRKGKGPPLPLLAADDKRHIFAESYRSLRSALLYLDNEASRPGTLLITSAVPGEGKSTVATNLARTLAFSGSRVLLIDADLRKGRLHSVLKGNREPGLSDALRNPELLDSTIQTDSLPNLAFISRGADVPNPGDLLLGSSFGQILRRLRERFDHILIDSSPVFAADDAASIAPQADGTVFVVRRGYSRSGVVQEALDALTQRQARILGVVFNRADSSKRDYHYYRYPEYYGKAASG